MRNFIKYNIENVKGKPRAASLIDRDPRYNKSPSYPNYTYKKTQPNNDKIRRLQNELSLMQESKNQSSLLLSEISEIKQDIKMIKSYLFGGINDNKTLSKIRKNSSEDKEEDYDYQQTVYTLNRQNQGRMKSYGSEIDEPPHAAKHNAFTNSHGSSPQKRIYKIEEIIEKKTKKPESLSSNSSGVSLKSIFSMVKDYKLEGPEYGTIFFGYSKRNSQPVVVKLFEHKLNNVIEVYDRLWKNIAKAEWPCINKVYDYKSEEWSILVMEKNKSSIVGLPYKNILVDIVKILEFIHDCGYLYRNIEPEHFMLNEEGQLVAIDFKRAKRYVDIKGHPVEVVDTIYTGSPFASNNEVRCLPQSRKDDLESLGYLALLLLEMQIPWAGMNKQQVIKIRSGLTLQELYKGQPNWIEYMAYVVRLPKGERPDYKYLCKVISS